MSAIVVTVANAVGVVASIASFVLALWHLRYGAPAGVDERRRQARRALALSIVSMCLLAFLSVRLQESVRTLAQAGSLENAPLGRHDVFYPVPYASPPYVTLERTADPPYAGRPPKIVDQRPDGFTIQIDRDSRAYAWKAVGRRAP